MNDPEAFNIDNQYGSASLTLSGSMFSLHYRNWSKDYFTSLSPSFQGSDFLTSPLDMSKVLTLRENGSLNTGNFVPSTTNDFNWNGEQAQANGMMGSLKVDYPSQVTSGLFNIANLS